MNLLNSYQRARLLLLTGSILCFIAFWFFAKTFHIPPYPGHDSSLLLSSPYLLPFLIIAVVLAISVLIGTAVAGMVRFNAGLLTADSETKHQAMAAFFVASCAGSAIAHASSPTGRRG